MFMDKEIGMFTNMTNRRMLRYINSMLESYDITTEQWNILFILSTEDNINQKQIAKKAGKDQPTVVRILDILERKKLIQRKSSKEDRRAFLICITDDGKRLAQKLIPMMECTFKKMLNGIEKEKLDIYIEVLSKINENILGEVEKGK